MKKSADKHKEVDVLETYKAFSSPDATKEAMMAKVVTIVSTRDYERSLEYVREGHGISRGAVGGTRVKVSCKSWKSFTRASS